MAYSSPTLSTLIKQGEQQFQYRFPTLKRNNVITVINRICAALSAGEHMHLDWLARQIIPTTAEEDYLIEYCLYKGIVRKQATTASGYITVTASFETTIPVGTVFEDSASGLTFITTTDTVVSAGTTDIGVQCETEGADGNLTVGTSVSLTSAILGVQSTATIKSMTGGADIESLSRLLARLIYRVQNPPANGAPHDYVRWATEVSGVTRAWCFERYLGGGSVGVAFACDDRDDILPTAEDIARVKSYITGHKNEATGQYEGMPANVELYVFAPQFQTVNFSIRLSPDTATLRQAVKKSLQAYLSNAGVGALLYLSQIRATVSNTAGEVDNSVVFPTADVQLLSDNIPTLGEITWL
ncbi:MULTISPECIES: baseplate J/gp47 family protein [Pasteurellaceae]|uniref:baseplate J/gp47 family protein n=1 Tax=Pasteurellaceae TaxID=712 RepID=UPI00123F47B9|nr:MULTISPECIES: baseplate J/gp47 family protein [Pasteurellaceae]MCW9698210.1 baseplate J/gp47 family protein [Avibacterium sp. 20-129]